MGFDLNSEVGNVQVYFHGSCFLLMMMRIFVVGVKITSCCSCGGVSSALKKLFSAVAVIRDPVFINVFFMIGAFV